MLIKFKNKMTMSLNKMIEEGKRLNGIPSHIEISEKEAMDIFMEIKNLSPPGYVITDENGTSARLLLNSKSLTQSDMEGYVTKWKDNQWKVDFHKIPIVVIIPTPQTVHLYG